MAPQISGIDGPTGVGRGRAGVFQGLEVRAQVVVERHEGILAAGPDAADSAENATRAVAGWREPSSRP